MNGNLVPESDPVGVGCIRLLCIYVLSAVAVFATAQIARGMAPNPIRANWWERAGYQYGGGVMAVLVALFTVYYIIRVFRAKGAVNK